MIKKYHIYINNNYICTTSKQYKTIKELKNKILNDGKITTFATSEGLIPFDFQKASKTIIINQNDKIKIVRE